MSQSDYDALIIGGGVNGCGIAIDLAYRGAKVMLCERGDWASGTSSLSSKLIHGGLRYLENYQFSMVRKSLKERERLLSLAQHRIAPLPIVFPQKKGQRPTMLVRLGLWLYDHLAKTSMPKTKRLKLEHPAIANILQTENLSCAFQYYDGRTDDAALVVTLAQTARELSADCHTRCEVIAAKAIDGLWHISLQTPEGTRDVTTRTLINASGPWVNEVNQTLFNDPGLAMRLVKGSHIVTRRFAAEETGYILPHDDGRIVFVLPFAKDYNLIGTTDIDHNGPASEAKIDQDEINYLLDLVNRFFVHNIAQKDIVWQFSGVRPLVAGQASAQELSREYQWVTETKEGAPKCTVYGGKLTGYRQLAQQVGQALEPYLALNSNHTDTLPLFGNPTAETPSLAECQRRCPFVPSQTLERWHNTYGHAIVEFLADLSTESNLGDNFGHGLFGYEVAYLMQKQWATTAEDILWRRSKLGLLLSEEETAILNTWMANNRP